MAKAKTKARTKPKKPGTKQAKTKPKAKTKPSPKAKAKTKTKTKAAKPKKSAPRAKPTKPERTSAIDKQVATLLAEYEDGTIDNAWDVIGDMYELDKQLSKSSPLRPAFDKMYGEIEDICRESAGG